MADLFPYTITYEGTAGKTLDLSNPNVAAVSGTIFDGSWKLTRSRRPLGEGGSLLTRSRSDAERSLVLELSAGSAAELSDMLCLMRDVFDADLEARTPGRLQINGSYLLCWCTGRVKELSCDVVSRARVTLTFYPAHPAWCEDMEYSLDADPSLDDSTTRYMSLYNSSSSPAPLKITLWGPADAPSVKLNGTSVGITGTLAEGERVVIDQQARTVTGYDTDGQATNLFGRRIKNGRAFEYAPSGHSYLSTTAHTMRVEVTLTEQRSEPAWSRD